MKFVFLYYYYQEKIRDVKRTEFPPLGMLYICSIVENMGHEVEVFYFDSTTPIEEFPVADVYAYSISSTASYPVYLKVAPFLKNKYNKSFAGNTHASIFPNKVLRELNVDAVFVGESEETVQEWIRSGMKQKGVIFGNRKKDIDFPFPDRKLLPIEKIYMSNRIGGKSKYSISMISSRGCVFKCEFCAIQNRGKVSFRTLENFYNELLQIKKDFPLCDGITLLDETFTLNSKHAIGVANIFKDLNVPFECNSRIDTLNENIINALAEAPCKEIRIGLETGSQHLLDRMQKGIDLKKAKNVFRKLKDSGIPVKIYLMHGFPGENMNTTFETINYLQEISDCIQRISLYRFTPLPGSPIYKKNVTWGRNWEDYTIYDNNIHWWGSKEDYLEMTQSYKILEKVIKKFDNL